MATRWRSWKRGRVYTTEAGLDRYVIREMRRGVRYQVQTGARTEHGALKEYERFDRDPDAYVAAVGTAFVLDEALGESYLDHRRLPEEKGGKGNSARWVHEKGKCLDWWREEIGARDLRRLNLADLKRALEPGGKRVPGYQHKVEVVKDFFGWMIEKKDFPATSNPTIGLLVPQARPGTRRKVVKSFTREQHEALVANVAPPYRWALQILAATGWHISEVRRFANAGRIEAVPAHVHDAGAAAVLVTPLHKSGDEHRTAVPGEALAAAEALRKHGGLSESRLYAACRSGCAAAKPAIKPVIDPGQYRHAVAIWAIEAGADPAAVAAFLGHRSPATTKRFYARHAVPPRVPTLSR